MSTIGNRLAKLERELMPSNEPGRVIQLMGSRNLTDEQVNDWVRSRGVDLRPDDRVIFRCLVGIDPETREHVYHGSMGAITVYDPLTGERQQFPGEDARE